MDAMELGVSRVKFLDSWNSRDGRLNWIKMNSQTVKKSIPSGRNTLCHFIYFNEDLANLTTHLIFAGIYLEV
jgi:hypothetical protein